jgi:chromosomal replication initiator protein
VREELASRIGKERYEVWFSDPVRLWMEGATLVVVARNRFGRDFLKRSFGEELMAIARSLGGNDAEVQFRLEETARSEATGRDADRKAVVGAPGERQAASAVPVPSPGTLAPGALGAGPSETGAAKPSATGACRKRDQAPADRPVRGRPAGRFADFLVGVSNRMAVAAAELVVRRPGETSPLVIVGPSGVGKTHLLEAICGAVRDLSPGLTAVYVSSEQFTTSFLQALHGGGLPGFRRNCRSADVLVIDDIQFFVGKKATIVELQQTLDALQRQGRQVIVSCDRDVSTIPQFGGDLLARLSGGMVAKIGTPDADVRRRIVESLARRKGLELPAEVVDHVVTHVSRSARELAGAVNRLEATSHMLGTSITPDLAQEALADLVRTSVRSVRLADIEKAICSAFGLEPGALQSSRRAKTVNHPRMLAMFLARRHTPAALTEIGSYFGRRSHSTVIAAQKAVASWVTSNATVQIADAVWDADEAIRRVEDLLQAG